MLICCQELSKLAQSGHTAPHPFSSYRITLNHIWGQFWRGGVVNVAVVVVVVRVVDDGVGPNRSPGRTVVEAVEGWNKKNSKKCQKEST